MYVSSDVDDCRNLKDHTLSVLKENAVKLKELMLYRCGDPGFKGEDIWLIKTLETLIISIFDFMQDSAQMQIRKKLNNSSNILQFWNISL